MSEHHDPSFEFARWGGPDEETLEVLRLSAAAEVAEASRSFHVCVSRAAHHVEYDGEGNFVSSDFKLGLATRRWPGDALDVDGRCAWVSEVLDELIPFRPVLLVRVPMLGPREIGLMMANGDWTPEGEEYRGEAFFLRFDEPQAWLVGAWTHDEDLRIHRNDPSLY